MCLRDYENDITGVRSNGLAPIELEAQIVNIRAYRIIGMMKVM